jgi:quercetin dioxygenase-like cupin family protein
MTKLLQMAEWAKLNDASDNLIPVSGPFALNMSNSDGTGLPLLKLDAFGADIIYFEANKGVGTHVHDGDHILIVIAGVGIVEYNGIEHDLKPGVCYLVPGSVPHAISAKTGLTMIAIGNKHVPVDSIKRMTPV